MQNHRLERVHREAQHRTLEPDTVIRNYPSQKGYIFGLPIPRAAWDTKNQNHSSREWPLAAIYLKE